MGYYTRVLATIEDCNSVAILAHALEEAGSRAVIDLELGHETDWHQLILKHPNGTEIAQIERDVVMANSLAEAELEEFAEAIVQAKPIKAATWLLGFLPRVQCVYSFRHLSGAQQPEGFEALVALRNSIWSRGASILQADAEGFTNEDGYHILWQFHEKVEGNWWVAVMQRGKWKSYQMDLGNVTHRKAFLAGRVPRNLAPR